METIWKVVKLAVAFAVGVAIVVLIGRLVVTVIGDDGVTYGLNAELERGGCPGTPNCVSSYATTEDHAIEPIDCAASEEQSATIFGDAIATIPGVERTSPTSWVVYSRVMKLPADVSIEVSERGIEVFSASRLGAGDLGANRNRIEYLRTLIREDDRCS